MDDSTAAQAALSSKLERNASRPGSGAALGPQAALDILCAVVRIGTADRRLGGRSEGSSVRRRRRWANRPFARAPDSGQCMDHGKIFVV